MKKKNYIYQTDGDGKIKTKGWKKAELAFIVNFHKDIFNTFCELENVNDIDKIIKLKYDETIKMINDDYEILQTERRSDILEKYYMNETLKKEQIYGELDDNIKSANYKRLIKTCKNVNDIIEKTKIRKDDLGVVKIGGDSYFINYLYNQKGIKLCDRINVIQLNDYWNNNTLKSIKRVNKLPIDLIEGNIKIDKDYYSEALDKRINKSISLTLVKSKPKPKKVKRVKETDDNIRNEIIKYVNDKINECTDVYIKVKDLYDGYKNKKGRKKLFIDIIKDIYKDKYKTETQINGKKYKNIIIKKIL